jgi:hypothetical protein
MRSVRTESHFTEPGFISVFAHGCQSGPTGTRFRENSKLRDFDELFSDEPKSQEHFDQRNPYKRSISYEDDFFLNDEDNLFTQPCCESFADRNRRMKAYDAKNYNWEKMELVNNEELEEGFSREIEELFSNGVRSLLTTYMQKALQPAIKETLMESMGYKLSYGWFVNIKIYNKNISSISTVFWRTDFDKKKIQFEVVNFCNSFFAWRFSWKHFWKPFSGLECVIRETLVKIFLQI